MDGDKAKNNLLDSSFCSGSPRDFNYNGRDSYQY